MAHTIRVVARSRNEVQLKLYIDKRAYEVLREYAQPLCIGVLDLIRATIAEKFPEVPTEELTIGPDIAGKRAPKSLTDNREKDACDRPGCGHSWGAHNYDAQGNELPDGGPCIECALARENEMAERTLINWERMEPPCGRFV